MKEIQIREAAELTVEEFRREYYLPQRPLILRGIRCWPDGAEPTIASIGQLSFKVHDFPPSFWSGNAFKAGMPESWTSADYVDALLHDRLPVSEALHGGRPYLIALACAAPQLSRFRETFEEPAFLAENFLRGSAITTLEKVTRTDLFGLELFVGGKDAPRTCAAHVDSLFVDVVTLCLEGAKQFVVFPPTTPAELLYTGDTPCPRTGVFRFSRIPLQGDCANPDPARYPRFAEALERYAHRALLEPGCLFYMPPLWWHAVHNVGGPTLTATWRYLRGAARVKRLLSEIAHVGMWTAFKYRKRHVSEILGDQAWVGGG